MSKFLCIAGHGGNDPGAIGFVGGEHRYMRDKLFPAMKKYAGSDFIFHTGYNVFNRGNLVSLAKNYGPNTKVIEFHYDASSSPSARGGHVIIHSRYLPDNMDLKLRDTIKKHFGVRYSHRGHQGISGRSNLANVNRARSGGVNYRLLELGFGSNRDNANTMLNNTDQLARDLVQAIQGKPVNQGVQPSQPKPSKPANKTINQLAKEVIRGNWGNGQTRITKLTNAGYNPKAVQNKVDEILGKTPSTPKKTNNQIANEVIKGLWGNGKDRISRLTNAGYNPKAVQNEVDKILGKGPTNKKTSNISVDGYWGPATNRALQINLGTPVDGIISGQYDSATTRAISGVTRNNRNGSIMIRALQRKIGVNADGLVGPATIRGLQRYLGTPVDGVLSKPSMVVKEMQRRLNNGTF